MRTAQELAKYIVLQEEGSAWTHDPADHGGSTRYGITKRLADAEGLSLADLTPEKAEDLLVRVFYERPRISTLPVSQLLRAAMFDQSVHSGPREAIQLLQFVLNRRGASLGADGIIGHSTLNAVRQFHGVGLETFYGRARVRRYLRIAENDRSQVRYVVAHDGSKGGWIRRAEHWMPPDARMSHSDWDAARRNLGWGS